MKQEFSIPHADILVFTSPSNARAYFGKYKLQPDQTVIAIGSTTKLALGEFGVKEVHLSLSFDETGLLETIQKVIAQIPVKYDPRNR